MEKLYRTHLIRYWSFRRLKSFNDFQDETTWLGLNTTPHKSYKLENNEFNLEMFKTFWETPIHPEAVLVGGIEELKKVRNIVKKDSEKLYQYRLNDGKEEVPVYDVVWAWEPL